MLHYAKFVLRGDPNKTAIINTDGSSYTYKDLRRMITRFTEALEVIGPKSVMISCRSEFMAVSALMACIEVGAQVAVHPYGDDMTHLKAKTLMATTDLIISDYYVDKFILSLGEIGIKEVPAAVTSLLGLRVIDFYCVHVNEAMEGEFKQRPRKKKSITDGIFVNFHTGITDYGFKFSGIPLDRVMYAINRSETALSYAKTVVFIEKMELLHDIVNGILAPLALGCTVKFASGIHFESTFHLMSAGNGYSLYASAYTLEKIFAIIRDNVPPIKWMERRSKWLAAKLIARQFKKYLGVFTNIYVSGKITDFRVFNSIKTVKGISTLYTMCEVASFISAKKIDKIRSEYSVGIVHNEWVKVLGKSEDSSIGIVMVHAPDMAVTTNTHLFEETFIHSEPGKINTRDVGYIDDEGELFLINKDNFVFELTNGTRINTNKIEKIAQSKFFINDIRIVRDDKQLLIFISPDVDRARVSGLRMDDLLEHCYSFEDEVNHKVFKGKPVVRVELYELPDGLNRRKYKFLSRESG